MRTVTSSILVVCAFAWLPASAAGAAAPSNHLQSESTAPVRVGVDQASHTLEKVRGRFAPASPDRVRAARTFLQRHAGPLRISPDLAGLDFAGRSDDVGGTVVRFGQLHRGVPVVDGSVTVGFDPRGRIIHVDNASVSDLDVPARPSVSAAEAAATAEAALGVPLGTSRHTRLVIVSGGKGWPGRFLAWEVAVPTERPRGEWRVFVDSKTGAVVRSLNLIKRAGPACVAADPQVDSAAALVFTLSPVDALNDPTLTDSSNVDSALRGCKLSNLTSTTDLTGTYVNTSLTPAPRAAPPYSALRSVNQPAVNEATAYYHVNRSKEYLNSLGFPGVMNYSLGVNAAGASWDNSFYDPWTRSLEFGTGGVDDAQDPDIVLHEVMHAIMDDQMPGIPGSPESPAIGEGTSDYWAAALTDDGTTLGDACWAAWNAVGSGESRNGCVRRLDGVKQYPQDIGFEGHVDGEIYSAALWKLRRSLGGATADRLVIKSHTLLGRQSGFLDSADALLSADVALNGGAHAAAINDAMKEHGIPRTGTPASPDGLNSTRTVSCETAHPYNDGDYKECRFVVPGAVKLQVHFSSFATEERFDPVLISDGDYQQVQSLSGTPFASPAEALSAAVTGDTIVVRFKADPSATDHGFAIDEVRYAKGTPSITWATPAAISFGSALSSAQLNASASVPGSFVYTPPAGTVLGVGEGQPLKVDFTPADGDGYTTASKTVLIDVVKADQTISFTLPGEATFGDAPVTLTGSASSGLAVSYSTTGRCSVVGGELSLTGGGTCVVTATQAGDGNYNAAKPVQRTVVIAKAPATIAWDTPAAITYGTPLSSAQLNATPSVPGALSYTPAAGTVLDAGSHELIVSLAPANSTDYASATKTVTLVVNKAPTRLSSVAAISVTPAPSVGRASARLTRADTGMPLAGRTLRFTVGVLTPLCEATTDAAGVAACPFTPTSALQVLLNLGYNVAYSGEGNYLASSGRGALLWAGL